jgi:hypothetical protein
MMCPTRFCRSTTRRAARTSATAPARSAVSAHGAGRDDAFGKVCAVASVGAQRASCVRTTYDGSVRCRTASGVRGGCVGTVKPRRGGGRMQVIVDGKCEFWCSRCIRGCRTRF